MSFTYIQKSKSALSEQTLRLLETIDSFQYQVLNPHYQTLGDIHKNVTVEVVDDFEIKKHETKTTVGALKHQLKDVRQYNREAEEFNLTQSVSAGFTKPKVDLEYLEKYLKENESDPDEKGVTSTISYTPTSCYCRDEKNKRVVKVKYFKDTRNFVTRYIKEMMMAFYDKDVNLPLCNVEFIEELMAEYAMLHFLFEFYNSDPTFENEVLLKTAFYGAERHQYYSGVAYIGMSTYLLRWYSYINWERLFQAAHSQICESDAQCKRLKNMLGIVAPTAAMQDVAVRSLYDYLSKCETHPMANSVETPLNPKLSDSCEVLRCKNSLFKFVVACMGAKFEEGDKLRYVRGVRFLQDTSVLTMNGPNGEFKCVVSDALVANLMEITFLGVDYELIVSTVKNIDNGFAAEIEVSVKRLPVDYINIVYSVEMSSCNTAYCTIKERQTFRHLGMHSETVKDSPQLIEYLHLFRLWSIGSHSFTRTDEYDAYSTILKVNGEMRFFSGMTKEEFSALRSDEK